MHLFLIIFFAIIMSNLVIKYFDYSKEQKRLDDLEFGEYKEYDIKNNSSQLDFFEIGYSGEWEE